MPDLGRVGLRWVRDDGAATVDWRQSVSTTSGPASPLFLPPTTTMALLGDRVICAFCDRIDFQVRFIAEDLPVCEDCEAHPPDEAEEGEALLRERP